jgi:hypothetical protein
MVAPVPVPVPVAEVAVDAVVDEPGALARLDPCDWDPIIDGSGVIPLPNGENKKLAGRRPDILCPEPRRDDVLEIGAPPGRTVAPSSIAGD